MKNRKSIAWLLLSCFSVTWLITIARYLSVTYNYSAILIVAARSAGAFTLVSLPFFIPNAAQSKGRKKLEFLKTNVIKLHFSRSLVGLISMIGWFYSAAFLPLTNLVAISFLTPIVTTIFARFALKEEMQKKHVIILVISFLGALITVKPDVNSGFNIGYLFAFAVVFLWSWNNINVKKMSDTDSPKTVLYWNIIFTTPLSFLFALSYSHQVNSSLIIWSLLLGVFSIIANFSLTSAYKNSSLSALQPFDFARLIMAVIVGYLFLNENINLQTITGATIIFISCLFLIR